MEKGFYLFLYAAFMSLTLQAQLVVNNEGQVIVGAEERRAGTFASSTLYVEKGRVKVWY